MKTLVNFISVLLSYILLPFIAVAFIASLLGVFTMYVICYALDLGEKKHKRLIEKALFPLTKK